MPFRKSITLTRRDPGAYVAGKWKAGAAALHVIFASVQPASGDDVVLLPEGKRIQDAVRLYTSFPVQAGDEAAGVPADALTWQGRQYECLAVEPWQSGVVPHYKAIFHKATTQ